MVETMKKCGFIIANDDEKFLVYYTFIGGACVRSWTLSLNDALVFQERSLALMAVEKMTPSFRLWVLELYETDKQFALATDEDEKPDWL